MSINLLNSNFNDLQTAVSRREVTACVVGLGYVGLPLAAVLGGCGFVVFGVDSNTDVVARCKKGKPRVYERGLEEKLLELLEADLIDFTLDMSVVQKADVIFMTVGTPLGPDGQIDLLNVQEVSKDIGQGLSKGKLVVLKSTVIPGGTRTIVRPILEKSSRLVAERDFGLAFVPERTVEGNALQELTRLPKIIGSLGERSRRAAKNVFKLIGGPIIIASSLEVAETAKLFDNIYRDANIALVNELAVLCECIGVDIIEAIEVANYRYSRTNMLLPGAGVGGSCLTKDGYIFAKAAEKRGGKPSLIYSIRKINDSMPMHFIELVEDAFKEMKRPLRGSKIVVLGYAMKGETDDIRSTPAKPVVAYLKGHKVKVELIDPYVSAELIQNDVGLKKTDQIEDAISGADAVCILTKHKQFADIDFNKLAKLANRPCAIIDSQHIIDPRKAIAGGFVFRGVGRPQQHFVRGTDA